VFLLWSGSVLLGLLSLWHFAYTPGEPGTKAPLELPAELNGLDGKPILLVFAHPQCSCSRATMDDLARIRTEARDLDIRVFFFTPVETPEGWTDTDLWKEAQRIPGIRVEPDAGGKRASRFGASTSGQVFFYDAGAHLAFAGGITAFRGHSGDNDGHDSIAALLHGRKPVHSTTPVFGCGLLRRL
jgi:hypothetical protein